MNTIVQCSVTGIRYGFIPLLIIYAMKKDPRISWGDILSPLPGAPDPNAQQMMM